MQRFPAYVRDVLLDSDEHTGMYPSSRVVHVLQCARAEPLRTNPRCAAASPRMPKQYDFFLHGWTRTLMAL